MNAKTVGVLILLLVIGTGTSWGQSCAVLYGTTVLTDSCGGGDPLRDGTLGCIYWDRDNDGPDETDSLLEVGNCQTCVNFNCFGMNGLEFLGEEGVFFISDPIFCFGGVVPQPNAFYIRVIACHNDIRWTSETFSIPQGFGEILLDEWTCGPCADIPGPVTGLIATQDLCHQINVSWNPVEAATSYRVFVDGNLAAVVSNAVYFHVGLPSEVSCYAYQVRAQNDVGAGPLSEEAQGCAQFLPGNVSWIDATDGNCNEVNISWTAALRADYYQLFRNNMLIANEIRATSYRDTFVPPGLVRAYQARGVNYCGNGVLSPIDLGYSGESVSAVTELSASTIYDDRIVISWADLTGESGYEIWRTDAGHVRRYERIAEVGPDIVNYDDFSAAAGQDYYYKVNGVSAACGAGLPGPEVIGRRLLVEPISFREIIVTTNLSGAMTATTTDFDSDGDNDVIACGMFADKIAWYENDGNWNFAEHVIVSHWDGARKFMYADLDNDGDRDIVGVARFANQLAWWEKTPQGFTMHVISSSVMGACDFAISDMPGDGDWDIITAAFDGGDISLWENNGSEQFTRTIIASNFAGAKSVSTWNVDGDFDVDIIATAQIADEVACFVQQPNHTFEKLVWAEADGACGAASTYLANEVLFCASDEPLIATLVGPDRELQEITRGLSEPRYVTWGDVDRDEDPDLLVAANSEISWWRKSENRYYRNVITDNLPQASYVAGTMVEGDGGLDLIVAGGNEVRLYLSSTDSMTVLQQALPRAPEDDEDEGGRTSSQSREFELKANYPNPFNAVTNIQFTLPEASDVMLAVFDITGRLVTTLANGSFAAGYHSLTFDANALSSGVYFYRLEAGKFVDTRKMVLLK